MPTEMQAAIQEASKYRDREEQCDQGQDPVDVDAGPSGAGPVTLAEAAAWVAQAGR